MRLITVTVAWVLGLSLARALPAVGLELWLGGAVAFAFAALVLRGRVPLWLPILFAVFCAGGLRQSLAPRGSDIEAYNGLTGTITGAVASEPDVRDDRVKLRVEAETIFVNSRERATAGLVLVETARSRDIRYGDRLRATGRLAIPDSGDAFSYADYLARQGVFSIMPNASVEVIGAGYGDPILARLLELKDITRRAIADALPEPQAGLLTGILLGDERGISPELEDDFARSGAAHVVAISGFNMVIVSAIVIRALSSLFGGDKPLVVFCAVCVILLYSLFVGASPGILRAALMSSLLVVGRQLNRRVFLPASLAFAVLLLSLGDPNVLLDIGFQLSVLAVLGLGMFADPLSDRFRALLDRALPPHMASPLHSFLNEPLIVSLAAQIATFPLIILYFGRFSLVAIPVNLLIVPVQAAVLLLGLSAVFVHFFAPALAALLFWAELLCLSWTIGVVRFFAALPSVEAPIVVDGRLIQAAYALLLAGGIMRYARAPIWKKARAIIEGRRLTLSAIAAASVILALMAAMALSRPDGQFHLWLLDIGHSNAVLMQTPAGAQILVDGGRYPSRLLTALGDRMPFTDREIELLVITQPDEWDIAALSSVLDRYDVGAALYHGQPNSNEVFRDVMGRLTRKGTPIISARAGYRLEMSDGVLIEVLHPQEQPEITDRLGDQALVLRVSYGAATFLLTSDLSADGQREMLERGISPAAAVMQIPRHGTARALDTGFLALAQPQVALLQSDPANRRGDPDPDTIAKLDDIPLFRTDEAGAIHLSTDGVVLLAHPPPRTKRAGSVRPPGL